MNTLSSEDHETAHGQDGKKDSFVLASTLATLSAILISCRTQSPLVPFEPAGQESWAPRKKNYLFGWNFPLKSVSNSLESVQSLLSCLVAVFCLAEISLFCFVLSVVTLILQRNQLHHPPLPSYCEYRISSWYFLVLGDLSPDSVLWTFHP